MHNKIVLNQILNRAKFQNQIGVTLKNINKALEADNYEKAKSIYEGFFLEIIPKENQGTNLDNYFNNLRIEGPNAETVKDMIESTYDLWKLIQRDHLSQSLGKTENTINKDVFIKKIQLIKNKIDYLGVTHKK